MNYSKLLSLILLSITIAAIVTPIFFSSNMDDSIINQKLIQTKDNHLEINDLKIKSKSSFNIDIVIDDVEFNEQDELPINQRIHETTGDTELFWVPDTSSSPYEFYQINATLEVIGPNSLIYSNLSISLSTLLDLNDSFENMIYPKLTEFFGSPPDIDSNGKIVILIFDIQDGFSGSQYVSGFFYALNQYLNEDLDPIQRYSNEAEILFIDGKEGLNLLTGGDFETIAHELQHMIHFGNDEEEHLWLDEGASMFAEYLIGEDPFSSGTYKSGFQSNPDVSLTYWDYNDAQGLVMENYGAAFAFYLYLAEHYGGSPFIQNIVQRTTQGIESIEESLTAFGYSTNFREVFRNWTIANFLDDTSFANGSYGYDNTSITMSVEHSYSNSALAHTENAVPYWGTDYLVFNVPSGSPFNFEFHGTDDAGFVVTAILSNTSSIPYVIPIQITYNGFGNLSTQDLGLSAEKITLAISSYPIGSTPDHNDEEPAPSQSYWFMVNPLGVTISLGNLTFSNISSPLKIWNVTVKDNNNFYWKESDSATYELLNITGVTTTIFGNLTYNIEGNYWESSNIDISGLPDGEYNIKYYFCNDTSSGISYSETFIISTESSTPSSTLPSTSISNLIPGFFLLLAIISLSTLVRNREKK